MSAIITEQRWNLAGKKALVTGGTKGIGEAVVREFLALGAQVLLAARNAADVHAAVEYYRRDGADVSGVAADISTAEGRNTVLDAVQSWGTLDILVNNVGTNIRKKTVDYSDLDYDTIMNTNLRSTFELARLCYPFLKQSEQGNIVNISSVAGAAHVRTGAIYGMSKAALLQLTRNLAVEWASDNIRVNAVAPWYIHTPLAEPVLKNEAYKTAVLERTPMNTIGKPEDVAAAVAFFCLPAAAYITGQCLCVDGGFSINAF